MDLSKIFLKDACPTSIGGQAVMEGIMMRGPERMAVACRLPDGTIHMKTQPNKKIGEMGEDPAASGRGGFCFVPGRRDKDPDVFRRRAGGKLAGGGAGTAGKIRNLA